jgi:hypothetical protein
MALWNMTVFVRRQGASCWSLSHCGHSSSVGWAWLAFSLGNALLSGPSYPYQISATTGLFALDLWSFAFAMLFGLIVINPA